MFKNVHFLPWLVWLNELNASLRTKESPVRFPVKARAWVVGQVPTRGCVRGNHILMFLSLFFSCLSPLSKNLKQKKKKSVHFLHVLIETQLAARWSAVSVLDYGFRDVLVGQ